jgi:hypothetical protein
MNLKQHKDMAYDKGMITAPVSIADVQKCVPVLLKRTNTSTGQVERRSSSDVGVLCSAQTGNQVTARDGKGTWTVESRVEINMWARYKPETAVTGLVTYFVHPITLQQRKLNSYGIRALQNQGYGSLSALVTDLRNNTAKEPFVYVKPSGGISSPYRLTDFENYWHNAPCPIVFPYNTTDKLGVTSSNTLQLYYYVSEHGSTYGLGLADLRLQNDSEDLSTKYFGILIYNANNYYAGTQSTAMGRGSAEGLDVTLTGVTQTPAKYTMIPFFATRPIANQSSSFSGTIYPMIFAKGEIETASEAQYFAISVWIYAWSNKLSEVRMKYSVINRTSASRNFNTGTSFQSYFTIGDPSQSGTYLRESIEINVPCAAGVDTNGDILLK